MDCPGTSCKTKGSLGEQEISGLFSNELPEVPVGSDSDTDSGGDWGKTVNLSPVIQSESDSESSSEESAGTATWGTVDKTPNLGKFTGNPGVKVFPLDPKEVSDIADLFLEIVSSTCYVRKTTDTISKPVKSMTEAIRC
jgi:hypothetical protein